jgi:hypothetical protein
MGHIEGRAVKPKMYTVLYGAYMLPDGATAASEEQVEAREKRIDDFETKQYLARHIMINSIPTRLAQTIKDEKDPKLVWEAIVKDAEDKSDMHQTDAQRRLHEMRCDDEGDLKAHLTEMIQLSQELAAMGSTIADKDLTAIIMASLPPSYRSFLQSITASARVVSKTIEPFDLVHWVTEEYELRLKQTQRDKGGGTVLSVKAGKGRRGKEKKKKRDVECFNCHKIGHTIAECWHPGGGKEGQGPHQKKKGSPSNTAATATEDENFTFIATLMPEDEDDSKNEGIALRCTSEFGDIAAAAPDDPDRQRDAIMDSGANRHFCPHKPLLTKFQEVKRTFKTADGKVCHALGIGELEIELPNGSESTTVTLKDVLYAPSLHFSLISIGRLDDAGCKMTFGDGTCEIMSPGKQGRTIAKIPKEGNLYRLHAPYSSRFADAANTLTARLTITDLH